MKYFDLNGNKVVIHADALAIPVFNDIWDNNEDKSIATNIIKFIVLNNEPSSVYVTTMPAEKRREKLKNELLGGDDKLMESLYQSELAYIEFTDTLIIKMLRGIRTNIELMTKSLDKAKNEDMSFRDMKELLDLAAKAEKAIVSIKSLEEQVRKDELDTSTVRGGGKIGYYETPRK